MTPITASASAAVAIAPISINLTVLAGQSSDAVTVTNVHSGGLLLVTNIQSHNGAWGHTDGGVVEIAGPGTCTNTNISSSAPHGQDPQLTGCPHPSHCHTLGLTHWYR